MSKAHALLLALLLPAMALAEGGYAEHFRAAVGAYRSGDAPAFLESASAARVQRPDAPQSAYLLAAALAMNGESGESMELLEALAQAGLSYQPADEPAFAALGLKESAVELLARFELNGRPAGQAEVTFAVGEPRFIPEGIAYDASSGRFLLGSIHQRRILAIDASGAVMEFVSAGRSGLLSVFGMQLHERSRSLYVATSGLRESGGIAAEYLGRAGIMQFDLDSGLVRAEWWLPEDGREHVFGEILLLDDASLVVSDSLSGEILRLDTRSGRFETLLPSGTLVSPQGMAPGRTPGQMFVADYRGGIFRLDLADHSLLKLREGGTTHHGIDGLYRSGDWLVAIQNGIRPNRVVALQLDSSDESVTGFRVLAAALETFDDPNLGVVVGDQFHFIANSHWPHFDAEGHLPDGLDGPLVLSVDLPDK